MLYSFSESAGGDMFCVWGLERPWQLSSKTVASDSALGLELIHIQVTAQNKQVNNEDISDKGRHRREHKIERGVALNHVLEGDQFAVWNYSQEGDVQGGDWPC